MAATKQDLDRFHEFASERLVNGKSAAELDELLMEWYDRSTRDDVNAAIREGLRDADAGNYRPACEVSEELRQQYGLAAE